MLLESKNHHKYHKANRNIYTLRNKFSFFKTTLQNDPQILMAVTNQLLCLAILQDKMKSSTSLPSE